MTDADRLRDAAQALMADVHPLCRTEGCSCQQERKVAALLRAVADSARQQGTDAVWWPLVESGIWTDSLALADVILGVTDE